MELYAFLMILLLLCSHIGWSMSDEPPAQNKYVNLFNQIAYRTLFRHTEENQFFDEFDHLARSFMQQIITHQNSCNSQMINDHQFLHNLFVNNKQIVNNKRMPSLNNVNGTAMIKMIIALKIRYNSIFELNEMIPHQNCLRNFLAAFECMEKVPILVETDEHNAIEEAMNYVMDLSIYPFAGKENKHRQFTVDRTNRVFWNVPNPNHKLNFDMLRELFKWNLKPEEIDELLTKIKDLLDNETEFIENKRQKRWEKFLQKFLTHLTSRISTTGIHEQLSLHQKSVACQLSEFGKGLAIRMWKRVPKSEKPGYNEKMKKFEEEFLNLFVTKWKCTKWSASDTAEFMAYEAFLLYEDAIGIAGTENSEKPFKLEFV